MLARFILPAVTLVALSFSAVPPAAAAPPRARAYPAGPAVEAGFLFTWVDFEDDALLDEDLGFSPRFGILFNPHHEMEFVLDFITTNDILAPAIEVDIDQFQVCYVYNFTRHEVVPYFTAGLGWIESEFNSPTVFGSEETDLFTAGGGVRLFFGRTGYARFEARWTFFEGEGVVFDFQDDISMFELGAGMGWRF